mmetsp:Transcript_7656/g.13489  ORF Transcript_7656/g.13489 Transcript_7656/m.13489 type:complete len:315 (+) Transcript_7656:253-1197(+)
MECTEYIQVQARDSNCECTNPSAQTTTPLVSETVMESERNGKDKGMAQEEQLKEGEQLVKDGVDEKDDYSVVQCDWDKIPSPQLGVKGGETQQAQECKNNVNEDDRHHDYMDHSSKIFQDINLNGNGNRNRNMKLLAMEEGAALPPTAALASASSSTSADRIETSPLFTSNMSPSSDAPPTTLMEIQIMEENRNQKQNPRAIGGMSIPQPAMDARSGSGNAEEKEKESSAQSLIEKDERMFNKLLHMVFPSDTEASKKKRIEKLKQLPQNEKDYQKMVLEKKKKALMEKVNIIDEMIKAVSDSQSQAQSSVQVQ